MRIIQTVWVTLFLGATASGFVIESQQQLVEAPAPKAYRVWPSPPPADCPFPRSDRFCYAANFSSGWGGLTFKSRPPGSRYAMCLQETRLLAPGDSTDADALNSDDNIASDAVVTASSVHPNYSLAAAVDGRVEGFSKDTAAEWASQAEGDSAMLRLTWRQEQTIHRVWLFDRPNQLDQITAGMLVFSDGSTIATGELPDDARKGLEIRFAPRPTKWLLFVVTAVKQGSPNIGLSEIAVFKARH